VLEAAAARGRDRQDRAASSADDGTGFALDLGGKP
jgi:hypothetical protein